MNVTLAIILIIGFIIAYIIIISMFSVMFRATGLNKEKSRYQAISLFTNCGFTTSESELITSNRQRRKIAMILMIVGHVFSVIIVSLVVAMFSSIKVSDIRNNIRFLVIVIGIFTLLLIVFNLPFISKPLQKMFDNIAIKSAMKKGRTNIITVLDNYGKQSLTEIYLYWVPDELYDKSLVDAKLKNRFNLNLITVKRKNKILDVSPSTIIQKNDKIIIFGDINTIESIFKIREKKSEIKEENKNKISIIDNYDSDAMCEIVIKDIPEMLYNTPLSESVIKSKYNITIIMIKRNNSHELTNKDTIIKENDVLIVFGPYKNIKDIFRCEIDMTTMDEE